MIVVLNGPLGIGKSTLSEALVERLDSCVMLDGDAFISANPPPSHEVESLHAAILLLADHYRNRGYRHFVVNHIWRSPEDLDDLRRRFAEVEPDAEFRVFLLQLPLEENLERIQRRQSTRALDELDFELRTVHEERALILGRTELGEPFEVSRPPGELAELLLMRLGFASNDGS